MTDTASIVFEAILLIAVLAVLAIPAARIVKRLGFPVSVRPLMVLGWVVFPAIMLWIVAYADWPALERPST